MAWEAEDERRVAVALGAARDALIRHDPAPHGPDIVFYVIKEVVEVHRRMTARDHSPSGWGTAWPDILQSAADKADDWKQRMIDLAAGDSLESVFGFVARPLPQEISTMDSVNTVFRSCLVGQTKAREWKVLHLLASGATTRQAGKLVKTSHARVADRKMSSASPSGPTLRS